MAKVKTKWVCQNCGYEAPKYLGKCPECSKFATFIEEKTTPATVCVASRPSTFLNGDNKIEKINEIALDERIRYKSDIDELDRVLGGGFVQGSLVLLAGDPGIGKSTLVLQITKSICEIESSYRLEKNEDEVEDTVETAEIVAQKLSALYICAEESPMQVKLRAKRLGVKPDSLYLSSQNCINEIIKQIDAINPDFLIVDSIQSVFCADIPSGAGSVTQIRECTSILMRIAKQRNITTIIIGHVTKDGNIAGPKVLEHMVDCVINFEGDKFRQFRILRCIKNRFGAVSEVGVFKMEDEGLVEINSPSQMLLEQNCDAPGSAVVAALEGSRIFLHEIQALVGSTGYVNPRRVAVGIEYNRLLQILAVLEKKVGLNLSKLDVYVNVAGGIDIVEPSYDLALCLAVISSIRDLPVSPTTIVIGEVGLLGEIRYVDNIERRLKEAYKLGFEKAIIPRVNDKVYKKIKEIGLEINQVSRITDAIMQGFR